MRFACAYALLAVVALVANRPVPKWQASGNISPHLAERCAKVELQTFGEVTEERGDEPEGGSYRLYLRTVAGKRDPRAVIYMDGEPGFTALWMDAEDTSLGDSIWRQIESKCNVA